jgi:hypothetical protein
MPGSPQSPPRSLDAPRKPTAPERMADPVAGHDESGRIALAPKSVASGSPPSFSAIPFEVPLIWSRPVIPRPNAASGSIPSTPLNVEGGERVAQIEAHLCERVQDEPALCIVEIYIHV